jgi:hypothetical protein
MKAMRHKDAIRDNAVERYLLGEMTEDQRAIFEKHYFDCPVCAVDVTDGTRMMMAGKRVATEDPQTWNVVPMPKPFWYPAAAAASLAFTLLGGSAGYLVAVRQQHVPTELVRVVGFETGVSRAGTPTTIPVVRPGDGLRFDIEPSDDAVRYDAVVTCGGKTQSTHGISRKMAADAVTLRIGELPAGRCELVVQGVRKDGNRFRITSNPFKVGER